MVSREVLALFTTPIRSSIKDSISLFHGSYGRCGQRDSLYSFEGKKSPTLPTFGQRNGSATCGGLLFYIKVRRLSRGKCLSRLYEFKNEVKIFLRESKNNLYIQFHNEEFVVMLAYLADVVGHLNDMNLSLQGLDVSVSDVKDKLAALTAQMGVWQARIKVGSTTSFPLLERRLKMNRIDLTDDIKLAL